MHSSIEQVCKYILDLYFFRSYRAPIRAAPISIEFSIYEFQKKGNHAFMWEHKYFLMIYQQIVFYNSITKIKQTKAQEKKLIKLKNSNCFLNKFTNSIKASVRSIFQLNFFLPN
jgi:hypothetical protein